MALVDTNFRYVSYSLRQAVESGFEDMYVSENKYLPLEYINMLNAMEDYKALEREPGVFRYVAVEDLLHKNIFYGNAYVGRLAISNVKDPVQNAYYRQVLMVLCEYVEKLYTRYGTFWHSEKADDRFKRLLCTLLEQKAVEEDTLHRMSQSRGDEPGDQFYLLQLKSHFSNNQNLIEEAIIARLNTLFPGVCSFSWEHEILALINISRYERLKEESFSQVLAYFLRDSLFMAGISRKFSDLRSLHAAYRQTSIALEIGPPIDTTYWYFKFNDYAYEYLMHCGYQGFTPDQVCHRAIPALREYDRENDTQLNMTLKTYILLQYNAVAAANALFVARSTFLKRLERIRALTGIDLDSKRQRHYLILSYDIYDMYYSDGYEHV